MASDGGDAGNTAGRVAMSAGFADILEQNMERGRGPQIDLAQGMDLVWKKGSTEQTKSPSV